MLAEQMKEERLVGAICAAPVYILANNDLMKNVDRAVCHPTVLSKINDDVIRDKFISEPTESEQVIYSNNCLTSMGPGTTIPFSLRLVELLYSKKKA